MINQDQNHYQCFQILIYVYYISINVIFLTYRLDLHPASFRESVFIYLIWPLMLIYMIGATNGLSALFVWVLSPILLIIFSIFITDSKISKMKKWILIILSLGILLFNYQFIIYHYLT